MNENEAESVREAKVLSFNMIRFDSLVTQLQVDSSKTEGEATFEFWPDTGAGSALDD